MFYIQVGDYPQDVAKHVYGTVHVSELLSSGNLSLQPLINDMYIFIHLSNYVYYHPLNILIYVSSLLITYYHTVHRGTAQN